jgi:hypothetical protein
MNVAMNKSYKVNVLQVEPDANSVCTSFPSGPDPVLSMANHSAMTWDKDQRLVKAEHGMNSSAYPLSQGLTKLSTQHHQGKWCYQ